MADLDAELQSHLAMSIDAFLQRGESVEEATRHARAEFGNVMTVREVTRDAWPYESVHRLVQDVRYALRGLARAPGFAVVAVTTLALGIGANTAIFSVLNGVLLAPLPYPRGDRLVSVSSQFPQYGFGKFPLDPTEFVELRARNRALEEVGAYEAGAVNVGAEDGPTRVPSAVASASLFSAVRVPPVRGRAFDSTDMLPSAPPVAVLSAELWTGTFGGRPMVGQRIRIDNVETTVVGIMPPGFDVEDQNVRIWLPLKIDPAQPRQYSGLHSLSLIGRLKDGVSLDGARVDLESMLRQWLVADGGSPDVKPGTPGSIHTPDPVQHRLRYEDLQAAMIGGTGRALWILQAAVGCVWLIACANMANLLLMRAESRHKELSLRAALGAGRVGRVRQFLAESLVLSLAGATLGVVLAAIGVHALLGGSPLAIPRAQATGVDWRVLAFTVIVALATAMAFGVVPLGQLSSRAIGLALRDAGSRTTGGTRGQHVRSVLVATEVALAVVLVIGAGLLARSFWEVMRVDVGFDRTNLLTFRVTLPSASYPANGRRVAFFDDLVSALAATPGVQSAAAMTGLPPQRLVNANTTQFEGPISAPGANGGAATTVDYYQTVAPTYFAAMRIPILEGRSFGQADGPASPPVAIINQAAARLFFRNAEAVGRRVKPGGGKAWFLIIGVAKDVKQGGMEAPTGTELYLDVDQAPAAMQETPLTMHVVLRTTSDETRAASEIRGVVRALDPSLPVAGLRTMEEVFSASVSQRIFLARVLGAFAVVALELTQGRGHRDKPVRFGREVSDGKGISSDTAPIQPRVQA